MKRYSLLICTLLLASCAPSPKDSKQTAANCATDNSSSGQSGMQNCAPARPQDGMQNCAPSPMQGGTLGGSSSQMQGNMQNGSSSEMQNGQQPPAENSNQQQSNSSQSGY